MQVCSRKFKSIDFQLLSPNAYPYGPSLLVWISEKRRSLKINVESTPESHFNKSVTPVSQHLSGPGVVIVSNRLALAIKIGGIKG